MRDLGFKVQDLFATVQDLSWLFGAGVVRLCLTRVSCLVIDCEVEDMRESLYIILVQGSRLDARRHDVGEDETPLEPFSVIIATGGKPSQLFTAS